MQIGGLVVNTKLMLRRRELGEPLDDKGVRTAQHSATVFREEGINP